MRSGRTCFSKNCCSSALSAAALVRGRRIRSQGDGSRSRSPRCRHSDSITAMTPGRRRIMVGFECRRVTIDRMSRRKSFPPTEWKRPGLIPRTQRPPSRPVCQGGRPEARAPLEEPLGLTDGRHVDALVARRRAAIVTSARSSAISPAPGGRLLHRGQVHAVDPELLGLDPRLHPHAVRVHGGHLRRDRGAWDATNASAARTTIGGSWRGLLGDGSSGTVARHRSTRRGERRAKSLEGEARDPRASETWSWSRRPSARSSARISPLI